MQPLAPYEGMQRQPSQATSTGTRERVVRCGERSTGCPTGARSTRRSGRCGPSGGGRGPGYFTKRGAEAWLREVLDQARAGVLPGMVRTGVSFADACGEYLRYVEHDLDRKPSTLGDYRSVIRAHLLPAFGSLRLEDVTADRIEAWKGTLRMSNRTKVKLLTVLNGVMARARRLHRLPVNPMADVEKPRHRRVDGDRGLLAGGGPGAGPRGGLRAGRRDLPDRGVHRPAPRRARRAALARRRLRRPAHPRRPAPTRAVV